MEIDKNLTNQQLILASFGGDTVRAAHNAADGNDEADWELLQRNCPDELDLGEFIDLLIGARRCGDGA